MNDALEYMNIIAAAFCVFASMVVMAIFTQRSVTCLRKGMRWCAGLSPLKVHALAGHVL